MADSLYDMHLEELRKKGPIELVADNHLASLPRERYDELPLHGLPQTLALTKHDMAKKLTVNQLAVSKLAQRTEVFASSLRSGFEAIRSKLMNASESHAGGIAITYSSDVGKEDRLLQYDSVDRLIA